MRFRSIILHSLFVFFPLFCFCQPNIEGKVISGEDRKPLSFANVFISNSTKGQQTDDKGRFKLTNVPAGVLDLVVSFIGYETISIKIKADTLQKPLLIMLSPDAIALQGVTVKRLRNGFERYYPLFKEHFLGRTAFSEECVLKNPKALWFSLSDDESELTINADEPLEIENKALGYSIKYDLEEFKYSFSQGYVTYYGFPFFQEMVTKSEKKQQKWHKNREKAYFGSPQHFLKSTLSHDWANAGYKVYSLVRQKKSSSIAPASNLKNNNAILERKRRADSTEIAMNTNPWLMKISGPIFASFVQYIHRLPLDENCIFEVRKQVPYLNFENLLYIVYSRESEEPKFASGRKDTPQISILTLIESQTLIEPRGHLANPLAVLFEGRWGNEKMGEFLPIDYEPESF